MSRVLFYKEIDITGDGALFWYEKYWEPGFAKPLWRYGYFYDKDKKFRATTSDHLLSRPNLKRIYGYLLKK